MMESRLARGSTCSCSSSSSGPAPRPSQKSGVQAASRRLCSFGITLSPCSTACAEPRWTAAQPTRASRSSRLLAHASSGQPSGQQQQKISGYTPANFISYSEQPEDRCHHLIATEVDAPASVCFAIWNDWNRLVDFLDLVSQIGLDPNQPDMALFQCFYRWGKLPVLEIVFLLRKSITEPGKTIAFETVQGMPAAGEVQFIESGGKTMVLLKLEHQLPSLLCDLSIKTFSIEANCRTIFTENLLEFKKLAEAIARDPQSAEPRKEAELRPPQIGIKAEDEEEEEDVDEKADMLAGPRGSMEEDAGAAGEGEEEEDGQAGASNGQAGPQEAAPPAAAAAPPPPPPAAPEAAAAAPKRAGRAASSSGALDVPAKAPGVRGRRKRDASAGAVPTA